jgi:hypothetical protein
MDDNGTYSVLQSIEIERTKMEKQLNWTDQHSAEKNWNLA